MDIRVEVAFPQLTSLGEQLVASLTAITEALTSLESTLDTELTEIAAALAQVADPAEVQAVADRVLALRDRVQNIIPTP